MGDNSVLFLALHVSSLYQFSVGSSVIDVWGSDQKQIHKLCMDIRHLLNYLFDKVIILEDWRLAAIGDEWCYIENCFQRSCGGCAFFLLYLHALALVPPDQKALYCHYMHSVYFRRQLVSASC